MSLKAIFRPQPASTSFAGIGLVTGAMACFATLDTGTTSVSLGVPLLVALWFRHAFQSIATSMVVLASGGLAVLRTAHPRLQAMHGLHPAATA